VDVLGYNREAWDREVDNGNVWTIPVDSEQVERARKGDWSVVLTPRRPVPRGWFPDLRGAEVLCLAGGGGQQGPLLAAAGGRVTVFDNSPRQLAQDRMVAERDGLEIDTVQGDMADLSWFGQESFDLVFHPCSNCFCEEIRPVWRECYRVLRPGGTLLSGFANPFIFCFDRDKESRGVLELKYPIPYSDVTSVSPEDRALLDPGEPLCFGHSLEDQLGGQLDAGFVLAGLYEDLHQDGDVTVSFFPGFLATRALKPA
jgi:SAM-dependent methyltransferase